MHLFHLFLPILSIATFSHAQSNFLNQSSTFSLGLTSTDPTYDKTYLVACHEGAAIEGLCWSGNLTNVSPQDSQRFRFNTSTTNTDPHIGILTYNFTFHSGTNPGLDTLWVPLLLNADPLSNVAVPIFFPNEGGAELMLEEGGRFTYFGKSNWYMCDTNIGYRYNTLAWAVGMAPKYEDLDIAGCVKVDVVKVD